MRRSYFFRAAGVLLILALCVLIFFWKKGGRMDKTVILTTDGSESLPANTESVAKEDAGVSYLVVYLTGAVREPGVYVLPEGSRLYQAILRAEGLTTDADTSQINEAEFLTDGQHIHIPRVGETLRSAVVEADQVTVNINTDDTDRLMLLPGIGEAKAKAIIRYRTQNGPFSSIEDIMNVSGIGKALFEQIKDRIKV